MEEKRPKRMPVGSIKLQFAGELVMPKLPDRELSGLFRRYQSLFENLANMDKLERQLNYKMLNGLMLTSYAKKAQNTDEKKKLFDLKNKIYLSIANDRDLRRKVAFKYLMSKNFRVLKFCDSCVKSNTEAGLEKYKWKFCNKCDVDRSFYNVLSMHHKFDKGSMTLFLSNDLIPEVNGIKLNNKGKIQDHDEEAKFDKFHYNVRNLDAFDLDSILEMHQRLLTS